MAVTLGRSGTLSPPYGNNIINVTKTVEMETIDVSNRGNTSSGYKVFQPGFKMTTWEIECHDPTGVVTALTSSTTGSSATVMSVTENIGVDGAVTFTVTAKGGT